MKEKRKTRLQRALCDKFQTILLGGRGRYLELEGTDDLRICEEGGKGLQVVNRGAPHSRGCSYMNLLRTEGARGRGGGVQDGRCAAKRIYVLPLGTRQ